MLILPSASRLGLGMKCMGSFMLPVVKQESGFSPEAEEGIRIHAMVEKYFKAGRSEEGISAEDAAVCRRIANTIGPKPSLFEKSELRLLLFVGRERNSDRVYTYGDNEAPPDELRANGIYCIVDLLGSDGERGETVYDFKTGSSYVPEPEWNWQLLIPAIAVWVDKGKPADYSIRAGIVHARGSNVGSESNFPVYEQRLSVSLLESRLEWLRSVVSNVNRFDASNVKLYEGKHCEYCPARARCPAKVGAIANAISAVSGRGVADVGPGDVIRAGLSLLDSKPQIDKATKESLKVVGHRRMVDGKPEYVYDLGDGREAVLALDKRNKEKVYTRKVSSQSSQPDVGVDGDGEHEA